MYTITNHPLAKPLRSQLENNFKLEREVADKAARAMLAQSAIGETKCTDYLTDALKALRRRTRSRGRALGEARGKGKGDTHAVQHLEWEVAYQVTLVDKCASRGSGGGQ